MAAAIRGADEEYGDAAVIRRRSALREKSSLTTLSGSSFDSNTTSPLERSKSVSAPTESRRSIGRQPGETRNRCASRF